jgi:hypothetical protein
MLRWEGNGLLPQEALENLISHKWRNKIPPPSPPFLDGISFGFKKRMLHFLVSYLQGSDSE